MQTITLIDNFYSEQVQASHNKKYAEALLSISGTELNVDYYKFKYYSKQHYLKGMRERNKYIDRTEICDKACHFLVLDFLYRFPMIFFRLKKKDIKIIATLHNVPRARSSIIMLRISSKYIDKIVVHSRYLCNQLKAMGISNAVSIDYPAFKDKNIVYKDICLPEDKYKIICLGGTRFGKGADLAIQAAGELSIEDKEKTVFIFAGKEEDIKYDDIRTAAEKLCVHVVIDNRVLPEADYWSYIYEADAVFLPYRKSFASASGPMTDGAFLGKTIIGPSTGNLGYTIKTHELGYTFDPENTGDMSDALHRFLSGKFYYSKKAQEYQRAITVESFLDKYNDLYQEIRNEKS